MTPLPKHLYEDKNGTIHSCQSSQIIPKYVGNSGIKLVWTDCEIDVPANQSFESQEVVTCKKCNERSNVKTT